MQAAQDADLEGDLYKKMLVIASDGMGIDFLKNMEPDSEMTPHGRSGYMPDRTDALAGPYQKPP